MAIAAMYCIHINMPIGCGVVCTNCDCRTSKIENPKKNAARVRANLLKILQDDRVRDRDSEKKSEINASKQ